MAFLNNKRCCYQLLFFVSQAMNYCGWLHTAIFNHIQEPLLVGLQNAFLAMIHAYLSFQALIHIGENCISILYRTKGHAFWWQTQKQQNQLDSATECQFTIMPLKELWCGYGMVILFHEISSLTMLRQYNEDIEGVNKNLQLKESIWTKKRLQFKRKLKHG